MKLLAIKPPTIKELEEIIELDRICFGKLWTKEGYQRELASPNSLLLILSLLKKRIGEEEDIEKYLFQSPNLQSQIIGVACFWSIVEEAHITLLGIHPDYRGQGLGQLLLYTLLVKAVECQLKRATLEVRASNQAALGLYQKFGFQVAGRRKGYYQLTGEDALIMWRAGLAEVDFKNDLASWSHQIFIGLKQGNWRLFNEEFLIHKCNLRQDWTTNQPNLQNF
ncbi:ribosomal protein S18-alanine N-acetyltransferase [Pleurocapsales cyanobacterium LEGE 06147]|nr:ribosomal protein S18-alanine N-acetyltransferase [Pleurocapsales cyanobacterium LEGE 06147]